MEQDKRILKKLGKISKARIKWLAESYDEEIGNEKKLSHLIGELEKGREVKMQLFCYQCGAKLPITPFLLYRHLNENPVMYECLFEGNIFTIKDLCTDCLRGMEQKQDFYTIIK